MTEETRYQKEEKSSPFSEREDAPGYESRHGQAEYVDESPEIDRSLVGSAMDDFSDRINNRFDQLDNRRKGLIVLSVGIAAFLLGIFFVYRTISFLF